MTYHIHTPTGRYVWSMQEYEIANFLYRHNTPFYSGIDFPTKFGDDTARSVDFVIPNVPGLHGMARVEWAGLWDGHPGGETGVANYRDSKRAARAHFNARDEVYHLIRPTGGNVPSQDELMNILGPWLGGADQVDLIDARIPASSVDNRSDFIAHVRNHFDEGEEISTTLLKEHAQFGESFVVRMYTLFPNSGIHELAEATDLFVRVAHYRETVDQYEERLREIFNPEIDIPSSHELIRSNLSWVLERSDHFYGGYRAMRERFGLDQLRRQPYTLDEVTTILGGLPHDDGVCPSTSDILDELPGVMSFLTRQTREANLDSPQQLVAHLLGRRPNDTRLPMATLEELLLWLEDNAIDGTLPVLFPVSRVNPDDYPDDYPFPVTTTTAGQVYRRDSMRNLGGPSYPIYRRLVWESESRGWISYGLPYTAARLTCMKPPRVLMHNRNVDPPPLINRILEDLSRAVQTHGADVVRSWHPKDIKDNEKRLSNNIRRYAEENDLSGKMVHYDLLRTPWLERRDARGRKIRCLDNWIGFSRDLQERHPDGNPRNDERNTYYRLFDDHHRDISSSLDTVFARAREREHPPWYVMHPFIRTLWSSQTPFHDWIEYSSES